MYDFINFIIEALEKGLGRITLLKSCHLIQVKWKEMKFVME